MNDEEQKLIAMEIHMLGFIATKRTILAMESQGILAEAGISLLQFRVLRALIHRAYTISELSPLLMVDPSTLVSVVDTLERKGLAERGRDPDDRRRVPISITPEGTRIAANHPTNNPFADPENPIRKGVDAMGGGKARQLLALLQELVSVFPDGETILKQTSDWVRMPSPPDCHPPL